MEAVRAAIGDTTFPTACKERRLSITFSFQIKTDLTAHHYNISVCFSHAPSRFSVIADRIKIVL